MVISVRHTPSQATETPISFEDNLKSDLTKILILDGTLLAFQRKMQQLSAVFTQANGQLKILQPCEPN